MQCEVCAEFKPENEMVLMKIEGTNDHAMLCLEKCAKTTTQSHFDATPRKLFLDDERNPPDTSWMIARTVQEARELMMKYPFYEISLDHDLGFETHGTGYDFLNWLERVAAGMEYVPASFIIPQTIKVHSQNPVGRANMLRVIDSIDRLRDQFYTRGA
jgi:hypothetical protein